MVNVHGGTTAVKNCVSLRRSFLNVYRVAKNRNAEDRIGVESALEKKAETKMTVKRPKVAARSLFQETADQTDR